MAVQRSSIVRTAQHSFGAGILSAELFGRLDISKYQVGLKECLNFIVSPHGPVDQRPGFEFVKEVKDSSKQVRLIPFIFNTDQAYVLEFGNQYMRVHTEGGTVLESSQNVTGATSTNPVKLTVTGHGYTTGDEVYIAGMPGDFAVLNNKYHVVTVVDANTLSVAVDGSAFGAYTSGGTTARVLEITTPYLEADISDLHYVQSADTLTIVHPKYAPRDVQRVSATSWTINTITFGPSISAPTNVTATPTGSGSTTYTYAVTAVSADLEESLVSSSANCVNDLTTAGNYNKITWTDVSGAIRYNIYKMENGLLGYIGQASDGTTGFKDDNITPDLLVSPPQNRDPFTGAGNYPGAVSYFEQRRIFAGTDNQPQGVWMTRPGTVSNLSYSIPSQDDDGIVFELASRQLNRIVNMVPMADLLLLTSAGEWKVTSQNTDAITPTSIWVRPQGYLGSSHLPAITTRDSIIYQQAQGSHIADMRYDLNQQVYKSRDISVFSADLFDDYTLLDWDFVRAPYPVLYAVRNDGKLVGLTYLVEQEVLAYHLHDTDGTFESVAAVPESSNQDTLYAVVKRTINGSTKRYIERMRPRVSSPLTDAFFVDSGLTYSGTATTTITGLDHLEGQKVSVLADGLVEAQKTVSNGQITLSTAASKVHVGLPYTARIETMPLALMNVEGFGQGIEKIPLRAFVRVENSRSIWAGPDSSHLTEFTERNQSTYGGPTDVISQELEIDMSSAWVREAGIIVQNTNPVPLTVLSIGVELAVAD